MSTQQQGDVYLFDTLNDGDIEVIGGVVTMNGGLETAVYLSLFGGNDDDTTQDNDPNNWWGNIGVQDPVRQYRSKTKAVLTGIPATMKNLNLLNDAIKADLNWLFTENIISELDVEIIMTSRNSIQITININAFGELQDFEYTENWGR